MDLPPSRGIGRPGYTGRVSVLLPSAAVTSSALQELS